MQMQLLNKNLNFSVFRFVGWSIIVSLFALWIIGLLVFAFGAAPATLGLSIPIGFGLIFLTYLIGGAFIKLEMKQMDDQLKVKYCAYFSPF
jgi:hypothetical protein